MIDIIIPTYGRADRIAEVSANVHENTIVDHQVWFVLEHGDPDSLAAGLALVPPDGLVFNKRATSYSGAINTAYRDAIVNDEWIFAGADDLNFHLGWDIALLACADANPWAQVIGTRDLINHYVEAGLHATHYLVRRSYLDEVGGVVDEGPGSFLHEGYTHQYVDTEFIATAKMRCVFRPCMESIVEHMHWSLGKSPKDATADKAYLNLAEDSDLYDRRAHLWHSISR